MKKTKQISSSATSGLTLMIVVKVGSLSLVKDKGDALDYETTFGKGPGAKGPVKECKNCK
jgi:hypothetical protein